MGKGRGCAEEGWEEESSRRSVREGALAVEGADGKRERLNVQGKIGKRRAVEGVVGKGHRQ
jgi:hypothetical protein